MGPDSTHAQPHPTSAAPGREGCTETPLAWGLHTGIQEAPWCPKGVSRVTKEQASLLTSGLPQAAEDLEQWLNREANGCMLEMGGGESWGPVSRSGWEGLLAHWFPEWPGKNPRG